MLLVVGALVNGPYALITTAVSADLGTHHSLQGNAKALSTVTAIIDGTGSMGEFDFIFLSWKCVCCETSRNDKYQGNICVWFVLKYII